MKDFTLRIYQSLLEASLACGYNILTVEEYFWEKYDNEKIIILRHDVDKKTVNSLYTAQIEKDLDVRSTYYFRILKCSNNPDIIRKIASLGHEIGYHYEDLALSKGNYKEAIKNFEKNLEYFREYYPVKTICMHGSPLSKWDNKQIWDKYSYRDLGIIAEPFFDLDFNEFTYISDTGRIWNNNESNLRDNIAGQKFVNVDSTEDLIEKLKEGFLGNKIHITTHPQRWNDNLLPWTKELIAQNIKNIIKKTIKILRK